MKIQYIGQQDNQQERELKYRNEMDPTFGKVKRLKTGFVFSILNYNF